MISELVSDEDLEQVVAELEREVEQLKLEVERKKAEQREFWLKEDKLKEGFLPKLHVGKTNDTLNLMQTEDYLRNNRQKQARLLLNALEAEEILLRENMKRIDTRIHCDTEIANSLTRKVEEYQEKAVAAQSDDPVEAKRALLAKAAMMSAHFAKISIKMKEFLRQHFPTPSARDIDQSAVCYGNVGLLYRSQRDSPGMGTNGFRMMSLGDIIQNLVNKHFNSPNDPYVTSDQTYWAPFVEILIDCGIAARNPRNYSQICLQYFE